MPPRFIIFYVLPLPHSPLHTPPAACSAHPRPMPRAPSTSHRTHLTPCHALLRPSSRTLPSLVTQSPPPRHALSHPSSRTLPLLVKHIQLYHYNAATTTKPHHRIHTLLRNGPFRNTIRPILERKITRFATHCLSAQYANAQQTQEQEHQILSRKICVFTQIFLPLQSQTYPKRLSRTCSSVG